MRHTKLGRYAIQERIATGGMGEVYRAMAAGVNKPVALKVIRPEIESDPALRRMFEAEARVALTVSHANVVQTFDVERCDGKLCLAMEYIEGLDVSRVLSTVWHRLRQPLPYQHLLLIAIDALEGLDYLHRSRCPQGQELGFIHRDISPGNLLVSCQGEVKVADFGIARSTLRTHGSLVGKLKGKLVYMAPEQLQGGQLDARADVYSMGAVLYEMLCGQRPFPDAGFAIAPDVLAGRFPRLRSVRSELPPVLEELTMTAMARRPDSRFGSAAAMQRALKDAAWQLGYVLSTIELGEFIQRLQTEARGAPQADRELRTSAARPRAMR